MDFKTRLLLNTGQFDSNIASAQKRIQGFNAQTKNASSFVKGFSGELLGAAAKFASFAGAGVVAVKGLDKFMRSCQSTSDFLDREINVWKGLFDGFFENLNSGDISGFLANMGQFADAMRDATRAADDFADAKSSMGVFNKQFQAQQQELINEYRRTKDPKKKAQLKEQMTALEQSQGAKMDQLTNQAANVINKSLKLFATKANTYLAAQYMGGAKMGMNDLMKLFAEDIKGGNMGKDAKKLIEQYRKDYTVSKSASTSFGIVLDQSRTTAKGSNRDADARYRRGAAQYKQRYGIDPLLAAAYYEASDESRDNLRAAINQYNDAKLDKYTFAARGNRIFASGTSGSGVGRASIGGMKKVSTAKASAAQATTEGSIAWYNQQISSRASALEQTIDPAEYKALQDEITVLKGELLELKMKLQGNEAPALAGEMGGSISGTPTMADLPTDLDTKLPDLSAKVEETDNYNNSMASLVGTMQSLGSVLDGQAGSWVNYGINAVSALAKAGSQIQQVVSANRTLVTSNKAAAISGAAASASAGGPFAWLTIAAAVASVIATLASIPQFATGGIVGGNSFVGDKVMARVNSGEMVLNRAQQTRLYNQINGNTARVNNEVEFKLRGGDLIGLMSNTNRMNNNI